MDFNTNAPANLLKKYFGYDSFRPGQLPLIESILNRKDVLAIMPTGGGKSICYQIPALMFEGVTLVISPLISLMHDQVTSLVSSGIPAAYLNSSLTLPQYRTALARAGAGRYKIIYVAPERLLTPAFADLCRKIKISMVAVDEAHCISSWGQNFRPAYLSIAQFLTTLPERPVVAAFTATATYRVRDDIVDQLKLKSPVIQTSGFDRPNLYFDVQHPKDKMQALWNFVSHHQSECGIVYCITRAQTEEVAEYLNSRGIRSAAYHAGLSDSQRLQTQEDFIYDRIQVIAATNAFGMGIDKSNVRFVVHYSMPQSMENYYQEAGRAGRDGLPSWCLLLYGSKDYQTNRFLIEQNQKYQKDGMSQEQTDQVLGMDLVRLSKMRNYCFTEECLRTYILQYFGEKVIGQCENCSHCERGYREQNVSGLGKIFFEALTTLPTNYGVSILKEYFHGSKTKKITQRGLDQRNHFGVLNYMTTEDIGEYLELFCAEGYLQRSLDSFQTLKATSSLSDAIAKDEPIIIHRLLSKQASQKARKDLSEFNDSEKELFELLRKGRMFLAIKNKVPPYIIFNDRTLRQMAIMKPANEEEMSKVSGVGAQKLEKYGEYFLTIIKDWQKDHQQNQKSDSSNNSVSVSDSANDSKAAEHSSGEILSLHLHEDTF